jgi:4-amino-4-deoxy-L-arabinose transferase-like glycosyltransferase
MLAFLLRACYFIIVILKNREGIYVFDSYGYWQIAFNVRTNGLFSQSYNLPIEPDYYRTPLYPLFIIFSEFFGPEGFSIIGFQIILALFVCYLTYKLAIEITSSKLIACLAAFILSVDVPSIVMNTLVMTETLFTCLLLCCVYYLVRYFKGSGKKHLLLSALFCGLAVLCRPIGFFLPALFSVLILYFFRKEVRRALLDVAIYSALFLVIISPWLVRNKVTFGHYFLSVIREHDMQNYQAAAIYAEVHNRKLPESQSILRWKTFKSFKSDANKQPYEYAAYIEDDAIKIMAEHPVILLKHHAVQLMHFFLKPCRAYIDIQLGNWGIGYNTIPKDYPIFDYLFKHNSKFTIAVVFIQLFVLLVLYLSILCGIAFFIRHQNKFLFAILVLIIFCFANLTLPYVTESRFRVPVMPYLAVLGAAGIYFMKNKVQEKINERKGRK